MPVSKASSCNKVRYRDHREAVSALHAIVGIRWRALNDGVVCRRREVRSYSCDSCKGFHLTSQEAAR